MKSMKELDLHPFFAKQVEALKELCLKEGFPITIYCGRRSFEEQAAIYGEGRTKSQIEMAALNYKTQAVRDRFLKTCRPKSGKRKTNALPGKSFHQYGLAIDGAPLMEDKKNIDWSERNPEWLIWAKLGETLGMESAARWKTFKEYPHLQIGVSDFNKAFGTKFTDDSECINWLFDKESF